MSIDVYLQDGSGQVLATYDGPALSHAFLKLAPQRGACLRFVLPWADATFNSEQVKELRAELLEIERGVDDVQRKREARALLQFLAGADGTHVYVKFVGD